MLGASNHLVNFLCAGLFSETADKVPEFEDLQFEAKSSKDSAW